MFESLFEGRFYTYLYLREDGTPYYVGKGRGKRAFYGLTHRVKPPRDRTRILLQEFPSEADAFEAEIFLIAYYGRIDLGTGCLHNLTGGGEGNANRSEVTRKRMGDAKRGTKLSPEQRLHISLGLRRCGIAGKASPSVAVRKQIAASLTGHKQSSETVLRRNESMRLIRASVEYRDKLRAAALRQWQGVKACQQVN